MKTTRSLVLFSLGSLLLLSVAAPSRSHGILHNDSIGTRDYSIDNILGTKSNVSGNRSTVKIKSYRNDPIGSDDYAIDAITGAAYRVGPTVVHDSNGVGILNRTQFEGSDGSQQESEFFITTSSDESGRVFGSKTRWFAD